MKWGEESREPAKIRGAFSVNGKGVERNDDGWPLPLGETVRNPGRDSSLEKNRKDPYGSDMSLTYQDLQRTGPR